MAIRMQPKDKSKKRNPPEILIITPESLHLLLAQKNYPPLFKKLKIIAVDEWHELIGTKRGVQTELAISRIIHCKKENDSVTHKAISLWGISATIGNLEEAKNVLLAPLQSNNGVLIRARLDKRIDIIFPSCQMKLKLIHGLGI